MIDEWQDNAASRQQAGDAALDAAANTTADGMARKENHGDHSVVPSEPSHDATSAGEGGGAISSKATSTRPADVPKNALSNASQPRGPHASTRGSIMDTTSNAALRYPGGNSRSRNQSVLLQPAALKRLSIMHSLALDDGGDDIIEEASESKEVEKVPDLQDDAKETCTSHLPDSGSSKKAPFRPTIMKSPTAFRLSHIREDMASAASMRRRRRPRLCLLKPDGGVRVVWDVATLILVIYIALITPVRIGFELDTIPGTGMFIWEQFIDVFFLLDIFLNFRTGFVRKDGALEMQPRKIAWNYLKTYFLIDLVSSFPIDAFVQSMENLQSAKVLKAGKILKVGRILKLAKLARLLKLPHLLGRFEEDITLSVVHVKLMRILLTTSLIAHLDACGWAFVSRLGDTYYSDSWVQAYGALDDSVASQYVSAMYWAITTMTTVGYGDIAPETDAERLYCLVTMIFGGGFYAYVIATLSSIVTNQDANQRMVTERMENIQTYMRIRKFPKQLARRVRKYYKHYYEMKTALNESTILEDLSPALRSEVVIFLVDQTVMQNPLFQQMSPKSFARLIRILFPLKVEEGEWVCREGEFGEEMFMLVSGKLEVVDAKGSVVAVLSSGAHFGELCALGVTNTRTCGVRALECCEMYALSKTDFFETFADSEPKTIKNMIRIAVAAYEDFDFQKNSMRSTRAAKGETPSAMYQKGAGPVPQAERGGDVAGTLKSGPSLVSIGSIPSAAAAAMGAAAGGLNSSFSSSPREGYGGKHQYSDPVLTRLAVLESNTAEQLGTLVEAVGRLESLAQTPGARDSARRRSQFAPQQHPQGQARAESLEQRFTRMGMRTSTDPQFASRIKVTASDLEEEDSPTFERIVQRHRRRSQAQRGSILVSARRRSSLARIRPLGK